MRISPFKTVNLPTCRVYYQPWPSIAKRRVRIFFPRFVDLKHMSVGIDHSVHLSSVSQVSPISSIHAAKIVACRPPGTEIAPAQHKLPQDSWDLDFFSLLKGRCLTPSRRYSEGYVRSRTLKTISSAQHHCAAFGCTEFEASENWSRRSCGPRFKPGTSRLEQHNECDCHTLSEK